MAFTVNDFHDLVVLLEQHAEWRAELRRLVRSEDFLALPRTAAEPSAGQERLERALADLAEAQRRTEAKVEELAEAQRRTEAKVEELAEAQRRTEATIERLALKVEELVQAQAETAHAVKLVQQELGSLANKLGVTLEEEAADLVGFVVEQKGFRVLGPEVSLAFNGEIDVVLAAETESGHQVSILIEAKARLSKRAVEAWGARVRDAGFRAAVAAAGAPPPYLAYAYGMRVDGSVEEAARRYGIGVATSRGEIVAPSAEIGP
jgi:hypothetical protein